MACCFACGCRARRLCAACANSRLGATRGALEAARAHASQRAATLEEQIDSKSFSKLLADVKSNAEETRQRAALARAQLADLRRRVQGGRTALEQRRTLLLRALGQLAADIQQQQERARTQQQQLKATFVFASLALKAQQQRTLQSVLDVLPLALVPGEHGDADRTVHASMRNVLLLDVVDRFERHSQVPKLLPDALCQVAALLDIVSRAFQLPLQHRSSLRGGLTGVWQPDSFWDRRGSPPALAPRLYWPKSSASGQQGRKDKDRFQSALLLLQRSIGMATHAHLGARSAAHLPPSWSPFAWLSVLCTVLAGEVAEGEAALSAAAPSASVLFGGHGSPAWTLAQSFMDEEEDGDWELTPHPLPPPPSQPEDVEHWTRAMTAPEAVATPLELVKGWAHMAQRWYQGTQ